MDKTYTRSAVLELRAADVEKRTVSAVLSTEEPVDRYGEAEVLEHTERAVDLTRATGGLPLLWNHDTSTPIGVVDDVKLDSGKLRGTLRFGMSARAAEVWADVKAGILRSMSIGYRIHETKQIPGGFKATRWSVFEASIVGVPADHQAGIGRSLESKMTTTPNDPIDIREFQTREKERRTNIRSAFDMFLTTICDEARRAELESIRDACLDDPKVDEAAANARLLAVLGRGISPIATAPPMQRQAPSFGPGGHQEYPFGRDSQIRFEAGQTSAEKYAHGLTAAMCVRAGVETDANVVRAVNASGLRGMSLLAMGREFLRQQGFDVARVNDRQIADAMLGRSASFMRGGPIISHGTSDFSHLMLDASNKALLMGFDEAPETWRPWVRKQNANDFKPTNAIGMSNFGDLDVVPEHAEYEYGTFSDVKESGTLRTYGKLFSISRQAIVNDDLSAFTEVPRLMGRAASRMVGDECYAILTTNPTLSQDSTAVFHTSHGNIYTTTGAGAPSVTTLDTMMSGMATRTDPSGATLNINGRYLLVPKALENTARALATAIYDPAGTAGTLKPNPYGGRIDVVADPRLDAFNAAGWFLAGDPNLFPAVVVLFLDGNEAPYIESQNSFTQDGIAYKVRLDVRAFALDYRPLAYNDGVA